MFDALTKDYAKIEPAIQGVTEAFLDWQWKDYLSKDLTQEYLDEIAGLDAGGSSVGAVNVGVDSTR